MSQTYACSFSRVGGGGRGVVCYIRPYDSRFTVMMYFFLMVYLTHAINLQHGGHMLRQQVEYSPNNFEYLFQ